MQTEHSYIRTSECFKDRQDKGEGREETTIDIIDLSISRNV